MVKIKGWERERKDRLQTVWKNGNTRVVVDLQRDGSWQPSVRKTTSLGTKISYFWKKVKPNQSSSNTYSTRKEAESIAINYMKLASPELIKVSFYKWGQFFEMRKIDSKELEDMTELGKIGDYDLLGFDIRKEDQGKTFYAEDNDIEYSDDEGTGVKRSYAK